MATRKRRARRRRKGEGSISPVPGRPGLFSARVELPGEVYFDADGKERRRRKRKTVYGTEEEIVAKLQELRAANPASFSVAARTPAPIYVRAFHEQIVAPRVRPTTAERYEGLVKRWIAPHAPGVAVADLTPQHVEAWMHAMRAAGAGDRTLEMCFIRIRATLAAAVEDGLLADNPVKSKHRPVYEADEMQPLDEEQLQRLLEAARAERQVHALWPVLAVAGLRVGEALALRWSRVHLAEGYLDIRQTLLEVRGRFQFGPPKTKRSRRQALIGPELATVLKAYRDDQATRGRNVFGDALVFCTSEGTPILRRNIRRSLNRLLEAADCPRVRVHDLRHTAATMMLVVQRLPLNVVADQLGDRPETVLSTYAHVLPKSREELSAAQDQLMGGGDG